MFHAFALRRGALGLLPLLLLPVAAALADPPTVGMRGAAVADPQIPPPPVPPCVVPLYTDEVFTDFSLHDFAYAPPAACPGPYAKIVLRADFSVTTGRQFDRTANIWIGGANLYFGTTQEPSAIDAPHWRIERDISDYASLLATPSGGKIDLGNVVNDTYTGILHGSAQILFYPEDSGQPGRPRRPDRVLPMSSTALGGASDIRNDGEFARTFTLPTNIERVFLDVVAQSQGGDEFWMTCVPDDLAEALQSCGHTAFRETLVRIDGEAAGAALVYPWLYTGAIDPGLWRPIPAAQTFSFEPWRVDLTPFAARLNDGQPHTIALAVFNAGDRFSMAANLLLYLDANRSRVSGALTENSLADAPTPQLTRNVVDDNGVLSATVDVRSSRTHTLAGYLDTSRGRISTSITQTLEFRNTQVFRISDSAYTQAIEQASRSDTVTRQMHNGRTTVLRDARNLPLDIRYTYADLDAGARQSTRIKQQLDRSVSAGSEGWPLRSAHSSSRIDNSGVLLFAADGSLALRELQTGSQRFTYADPFGACYSRAIDAVRGAVTRVTDGEGCDGGVNFLPSFDHFHNYASAHYGASVPVLP